MHRHGGPEVLALEQADIPTPGPGEIRVRAESASVNWSDTMRRRGDPYPFDSPMPFTPGGEVAGTVDALGDGVDGLPPGTPVLALAGQDGSTGYAQYVIAGAERVVPIPDGVSEDVASTILVAGLTALLVLTESARLQSGESVLIPGAAGGVGSYAVQIAKHLGAGTVIGLGSSAAKRQTILDLGADHALDPAGDWAAEVRDLTGGGVDVALETTGGEVLDATLGALGPFGRCVVYGFASKQYAVLGAAATEALLYRPAPNQTLTGFNIGAFFFLRPHIAGPAIGQLLGLVAAGQVRVPVTETLPLAQAAEAHRRLEARETTGKLVLKPWTHTEG